MTNTGVNAEMAWLKNLPRDIFTKFFVENTETSKMITMFDVV